MSLTREDMLSLMQFADGELKGKEADAIAKRIGSDTEAAQYVKALGFVGEHVRLAGDEDGDRIGAFDIADAVMAKVEREPLPTKENPLDAVALQKASGVRSIEAARAEKTRRTATVLAVLALAAAAIFYVKTRQGENAAPTAAQIQVPEPVTSVNPTQPSQAPSASASAEAVAQNPNAQPAQPKAGTANGVDVNAVESAPAHGVQVFYLSGDNAATSSVAVWVDDTAAGGSGK